MGFKRGQGMPLNVIIIAALCLLVLIVLMVMFSDRISIFGRDVTGCEKRDGICITSGDCPQGYVRAYFECDTGACCQRAVEQDPPEMVMVDT